MPWAFISRLASIWPCWPALVAYIVGKTGGSETVRKARGEQGVLIASGLMAGGAVFGGILPAVLRQLAVGAPIRYITIGEEFVEKHTKAGEPYLASNLTIWCKGVRGQAIGLAAFVALAIVCFLLARKGAQWFLSEQAEAEKEGG